MATARYLRHRAFKYRTSLTTAAAVDTILDGLSSKHYNSIDLWNGELIWSNNMTQIILFPNLTSLPLPKSIKRIHWRHVRQLIFGGVKLRRQNCLRSLTPTVCAIWLPKSHSKSVLWAFCAQSKATRESCIRKLAIPIVIAHFSAWWI